VVERGSGWLDDQEHGTAAPFRATNPRLVATGVSVLQRPSWTRQRRNIIIGPSRRADQDSVAMRTLVVDD